MPGQADVNYRFGIPEYNTDLLSALTIVISSEAPAKYHEAIRNDSYSIYQAFSLFEVSVFSATYYRY